MTQTVENKPKVEDIVERYLALRKKKEELVKAHKAALEPIDAAMDKVETHLLGQMQELGVDNLKTKFGTVLTTTKTSCSVADWESVLGWVQCTENWTALTRGVSKDFVKLYKDEHNDLPPGVSWYEERVAQIRKAT